MSNARFIYDTYRNMIVWRDGMHLTRDQDDLYQEILERMKLLYEVLP